MKNKILLKFLLYLRPYLVQEFFLLLLLLVVTSASLASPYILKIIIDDVIPSGNYTYLLKILFILLIIYLVRISLGFYTDYLHMWISSKIMKDIRSDLFNHIMRLPLQFFTKNKLGDVLYRINNDVNSIQNILANTLIRFLNNSLSIIVIIIILCYLNWKLFLMTSMIFPFLIINIRYFQPRIRKIIKQVAEKDSEVLSFFSERINNIRLIKTYNAYVIENSKLERNIKEYINLLLRSVRLSSGSKSLSTFLVALSPIIVFSIGGKQVLQGAMTIGALVAFLQYLNRLYDPLRDILSLYVDLIRASVSMARIHEILVTTTQHDNLLATPCDESVGQIVFKNVTFSYEDKTILDDISLEFLSGTKYAIVSKSGEGKSTLLDLLCNFYVPNDGYIKINNKMMDQIEIDSWRSKIALISQDTQLYDESLLENINYSNPVLDFSLIQEAAKIANIHDFISKLDRNYNTVIGENGAKLSGGQRQRVSISRAILKEADVFILDEATSAIDTNTEKDILSRLFMKFSQKIFIIVSHRFSTFKDVDEILFLEGGKIRERGSHFGLLAKKGYYWNYIKDQVNEEC